MTRAVTVMTIEEALHYTPEQRAEIIASYPEHVREARANGVPMLGSGAVFPVRESSIVVEPMPIPKHWPQVCGIDFGWDHPTAAVRMAWDRDADCLYLTHVHKAKRQTPEQIAPALRAWGEWIPWAWPHDGLNHDKTSGDQLAVQYRKQHVRMMPERATFADDGGNGVEAGVMEMLERMQTGRWKVFATCLGWLEEFRTYHRDEGLIVKLFDDAIDASRYAMMMRRFAKLNTPAQPIKLPKVAFA